MRKPVPFALIAALLACVLGALPGRAEDLGFIINSGDASISIIDMHTHREIRREPVLREPHHIVLSPDGGAVLVGDTGANELLFLSPATGDILRRMPVSDPYQLLFSPDGRVLTVTGLARNQVDIYDAASLRLLHRVPASAMPSHIAYAPDSSVAYVSLQETNRLMAIAVRTGAILWNEKVGETPAGVLWHDGKILVGDMGADDVAVVDPTDGAVIRRIHTGRGAHNLFLSPDRRMIYVSNRVDSTLTALDADSLAIERQYRVPGGPDDIAFAPDGTIWITQRFAHGLLFLNPVTGATSRIEVGRSPHGLWLNTDRATRISSAQ
jgi:DNA-binding beta-propeller fold protein YncE